MNCTNCGNRVDPRRVELGYDYCTPPGCQERCSKRVRLAAVAVNKASDQYVKADEVAPGAPSVRWGIDPEPADEQRGSPRIGEPRRARRRPTTAQRLERAAAELDTELRRLYEQFCRSELTEAEMRVRRNDRIRAFNTVLRRENIRYRSFLRKTI
jgi:hypothetical protein